jgi:hypothetical protein
MISVRANIRVYYTRQAHAALPGKKICQSFSSNIDMCMRAQFQIDTYGCWLEVMCSLFFSSHHVEEGSKQAEEVD